MKQASLTPRYALVHSFHWSGYAAIMSFASVYLLTTGFTNTQIGLVTALAGAATTILQPLLATLADRPSSPSVKRILLAITGVMLFFALALFVTSRSILLTGICYGSCLALLMLLTPLVNSLGIESLNQGKKLNFGLGRSGGSAAFAVVVYLLGVITDHFGASQVLSAILFMTAGFFFAVSVFPFQKTDRKKPAETRPSGRTPLAFFKKYPRFTVTLLGCVFVYISHSLVNVFAFQIIESKGGGSTEMGLSMAISACSEFLPMFFFGWMMTKLPVHRWFRMTGVFFTLKAFATLLVPDVAGYYLVQLLQMGAWALITVASVYYVNSLMEPEDSIKGQAYITMAYTFANVLASLAGGSLIDHFGVNAMLTFGSLISAVGMVIMLFSVKPGKSHRNQNF